MAELEQHVDTIASDVPKLDAALKNLLAFVMAETNATADSQAGAQDVVRGSQAAARSLSLAFNALQLPAAPQWGLQHPQGEEETALQRIESLARYKAAYAMHEKVRATAGAKPTHLFGRKFVDATLVWGDVRKGAEAQIPEAATEGLKGAYLRFLEDFEAGLNFAQDECSSCDGIEQIHRPGDSVDDDEEGRSGQMLAEILWSTDMAATLKARSDRRMARVNERNRREAANENDAFSSAVRDVSSILTESRCA